MKEFLASFFARFFWGAFILYLILFFAGFHEWRVYLVLLPIFLSVALFMEIFSTLYQWFLFSLDRWGK